MVVVVALICLAMMGAATGAGALRCAGKCIVAAGAPSIDTVKPWTMAVSIWGRMGTCSESG